jgi:hypothetical protein
MQAFFLALLELIREPLKSNGGVKTDSSILMIYPPEPGRELDFREYLIDTFVPRLQAEGIAFRLLDLTGFLFQELSDETIRNLQEDEFDDYRFMKQGLSRSVETTLRKRISQLAEESPGCAVIVYATVALHPLVRYGEVLRELRDVHCRTVLAFPGEERGGKLHFMNQPDGGNYLAVKLFWK